ncbi:basic proline-rich protein-like [Orycteropus afer afer]|uniref:Basic proline-rich protein-like n=1 Tax=Orycteropus afer afer TaxID=1230840 RepID=A0AC54Z8R5_ORYAF|nr:basic proline-rich protein-like [Orycteropus afer afer]
MGQLRPRDTTVNSLPPFTGRGGGNPPSLPGPSDPAKNRLLGHPRALSCRPRPRETSPGESSASLRGAAAKPGSGPGRPDEAEAAPKSHPARHPGRSRSLRPTQRSASWPRGRAPNPPRNPAADAARPLRPPRQAPGPARPACPHPTQPARRGAAGEETKARRPPRALQPGPPAPRSHRHRSCSGAVAPPGRKQEASGRGGPGTSRRLGRRCLQTGPLKGQATLAPRPPRIGHPAGCPSASA